MAPAPANRRFLFVIEMMRKGRGWTQEQAAAALGISRGQYAKRESGYVPFSLASV